jgi:hypothetical protein
MGSTARSPASFHRAPISHRGLGARRDALQKERKEALAVCRGETGGFPVKYLIALTCACAIVSSRAASAEPADTVAIAACKATAILALKEKSPAIRDIILDMDTISVSKASTEIEGVPLRTVIMGDAYLEKKETGKAQHFLCLIGDKGKVLLTFFAPS